MTPMNIFWAQFLLASDILKTMDQTANPCDGFYEFACGNHLRGKETPPDTIYENGVLQLRTSIKTDLRKIFEIPIKPSDPQSTKFVKTYYQSCMNVVELEKQGIKPLLSLIESLGVGVGGWPILHGDTWNGESNYSLVKLATRILRDFGHTSLFGISLNTNSDNSTILILTVSEITLFLKKREYYLDKNYSKIRDSYRQYMLETALQLGADKKTAERDVDDVIAFEMELANITDSGKDTSTSKKNLLTISEFKKTNSELPLEEFFDDLSENGLPINDSTKIYVKGNAYSYLAALPKILNKTKKRTFANYQIWPVVAEYISRLASSLQKNYRKYVEVTTGVKSEKVPERWTECVDKTTVDIPLAVSSIYNRHYFGKEEKEKIEAMVVDFRRSMTKLISETDWLDPPTKAAALLKMEKMVSLVGYPDNIFNDTWVMQDYTAIEFDSKKYFENVILLSKLGFRSFIKKLSKPAERTDWISTTHEINAFYSPAYNSITFPAGYLQYPVFALYAPNYVNYACIGWTIGHEITHAFDTDGRTYDAEGNEVSWWSNATSELFDKGAKCLIDQYSSIIDNMTGSKIAEQFVTTCQDSMLRISNFSSLEEVLYAVALVNKHMLGASNFSLQHPVSITQLNGERTVGENIADGGAIKLAYETYKRWSSSQASPEPMLHQLGNYSADQMFFISFAQSWCMRVKRETQQTLIDSDEHAPHKYRVNVVLGNYDPFAETFKCPSGSFMNPTKKCTIW